jgi:TRAP-type C4-dicarboxylate transport system permease small subunit
MGDSPHPVVGPADRSLAQDAMTSASAQLPRTRSIAAFDRAVVRLNQWLVIGLMASMAALVFANVITRYVFNHSIIWVEELTQYQMIWVAYLGAGLALRESRHVAVDTLQDLLPAALRRHLRMLLALAMAAFLVVLTVLGAQIAAFTWNQETPVLGLPTGLPYLAVPIGAAGMLMHLLLFWRRFIERDFEHIEDPAGEPSEEQPA